MFLCKNQIIMDIASGYYHWPYTCDIGCPSPNCQLVTKPRMLDLCNGYVVVAPKRACDPNLILNLTGDIWLSWVTAMALPATWHGLILCLSCEYGVVLGDGSVTLLDNWQWEPFTTPCSGSLQHGNFVSTLNRWTFSIGNNKKPFVHMFLTSAWCLYTLLGGPLSIY